MAWHVFEKLLEGVANYSTFIGKIWITFLFIFRIIMVASVGDTVYNDEQSAFICNTRQPGCTNVCFNRFSPISQIRFWAVQILFVGTPSVVFIVFAMHKMSSLQARSEEDEKASRREKRSGSRRSVDFEDSNSRRRRHEKKNNTSEKGVEDKNSSVKTSLPHYEDVAIYDSNKKRTANGVVRIKESKKSSSHNRKENIYEGNNRIAQIILMPSEKPNPPADQTGKKIKRKTVYHKDGSSEVVKTPSIARAYFAQAIIRMGVEAVFLYLQYYMYKFEVHELYVCEGFPCPKQVDCFVSRPKEKTLFLQFMYAMTALSLILNFIELVQLIKNFCGRAFSKEQTSYSMRRLYEQRGYLPSHSLRRRRRRHMSQAYPELGPFPRTHGNSFTDNSDDNSIDSDYRFYDSDY